MYPHGVKIIVLVSKLVGNSIFGCPQKNDVHEDFSVVLTEESLNVQGWDSMGEGWGGKTAQSNPTILSVCTDL